VHPLALDQGVDGDRSQGTRSWVDHRGSFRNTTVNGQITGFGLDLGVIDDAIIMRFDVERMRSRYGFLRDLGLSEPRLICSHFS
jgi:hypothetical protein